MNIDLYRIFFDVQKKHWWFVTKKNIVLDMIAKFQRKKGDVNILDVGCGSGLMLNALERIGQTYGMDISDEAISFSKEIFTGTVKKGMLPDEIPYEENFFDLIIALDVIEHVDRDIDSLIALHSRLTADGKAIITVPAYMFLWSSFDDINEHKRRYTASQLNAKLVLAGFTVEKISYYNTLLFPVVWIVRVLNNILNRDEASDIAMPSKALNFVLENIFGFEKTLLKFVNLPFGVSILAVVRK
jgi:2-polyprenyl-3-methyl-5-hydroxy-6-metoxy-1,4-benzoquinol methylase